MNINEMTQEIHETIVLARNSVADSFEAFHQINAQKLANKTMPLSETLGFFLSVDPFFRETPGFSDLSIKLEQNVPRYANDFKALAQKSLNLAKQQERMGEHINITDKPGREGQQFSIDFMRFFGRYVFCWNDEFLRLFRDGKFITTGLMPNEQSRIMIETQFWARGLGQFSAKEECLWTGSLERKDADFVFSFIRVGLPESGENEGPILGVADEAEYSSISAKKSYIKQIFSGPRLRKNAVETKMRAKFSDLSAVGFKDLWRQHAPNSWKKPGAF